MGYETLSIKTVQSQSPRAPPPGICFGLSGECNLENFPPGTVLGCSSSAAPKAARRPRGARAVSAQRRDSRCNRDHGRERRIPALSCPPAPHRSLWPTPWQLKNMLRWIVSRTLASGAFVFCKRPADGSLPLPVVLLNWLLHNLSYSRWHLTVHLNKEKLNKQLQIS